MSEPLKRPALRYHGGKWRLAPWIIQHMPPHRSYVEAFGGAASVLIRKPVSTAEVYNDLDGDVVNFFRVLRDPLTSQRLIDACALTPYARDEFRQACACPSDADPVERARCLVVRATMGFGSTGASDRRTGFKLDTKQNSATAQRIWAHAPDNLAAVASRFAGVLIENRDAVQCLRDHDTPTTLHYIDPPYLPDTRQTNRAYRHEMSAQDHEQLLAVAETLSGLVLISGYDCDLYNDWLAGWKKITKSAAANGQSGTVTRTECLWMNPAAQAALQQEVSRGTV